MSTGLALPNMDAAVFEVFVESVKFSGTDVFSIGFVRGAKFNFGLVRGSAAIIILIKS